MISGATRRIAVTAAEKCGWLTSVDEKIIAGYLNFYNIDVPEERGPAAGVDFYDEVWEGFRPYLVRMVIDFLIAVSLWTLLFLVKMLVRWFAIDSWVGDFIVTLYVAGTVGAFIVFVALFSVDLYILHRRLYTSTRAPNPRPEADT